jgi:hypothetical protein
VGLSKKEAAGLRDVERERRGSEKQGVGVEGEREKRGGVGGVKGRGSGGQGGVAMVLVVVGPGGRGELLPEHTQPPHMHTPVFTLLPLPRTP